MDQKSDQKSEEDIRRQVTEIVSAYVSKNEVAAADLPALIKSVHATLGGISGEPRPAAGKPPAVPVKKSVTPDYIICLEDGKKLKMLKRYLRTRHGLTPDAYRAKWNLPADYPMTAPNYAARRSDFAKQIGLGKPARKKRADPRLKSAPFLCALVAALLLPFLLVDVPPVLDYPNHLARWYVLAHPDDPILSRFWAPHWSIIPNLGFDLIGLVLMKLLPVHLAGRLMLAMSVLAPVAGAMIYSRAAFGRWCGWALASGLAAYSGIFFLGFMNFLLGVGLGFAAAGLWLILVRRSDTQAVLAGALGSAVLFFCHIFGVALFGLLITSAEAERLWVIRKTLTANHVLRRLGLLLLTLSPALLLYAVSPLAGGAAAPGEWVGADKAWNLLAAFLSPSKPLAVVTVCCVMAFLILTGRGARYAPGARLALGVLLLLFLWAPDSFKGGTFLDVRLALMAAILLFAGFAPSPRPPRLWAALFAGLILVRSAVVAWSWHGHAADLADFRAVIAHVPPGSKVLAAQGPAPERLVIPGLYRLDSHMPALLAIEREAFWPLMFADPSQQPLMVRPPYDRIASPPLGETPDWDMLTTPGTPALAAAIPYLKNWRADFDYVLLIDRPLASAPPAGLTPVMVGSYAALYSINR